MQKLLFILFITSFSLLQAGWWTPSQMPTPSKLARKKHFKTFDSLYVKYSNKWNTIYQQHKRSIKLTPFILKGIAYVESTWRPELTHNFVKNSNGSNDVGLMGINNIHLPTLRKMGMNMHSMNVPEKAINFACKVFEWQAKPYQRKGLQIQLNSYNGKAYNNPNAYGRKVMYISKLLQQMQGKMFGDTSDYTEYTKLNDLENQEADINYADIPVTQSPQTKQNINESNYFYECQFPWNKEFLPHCNGN